MGPVIPLEIPRRNAAHEEKGDIPVSYSGSSDAFLFPPSVRGSDMSVENCYLYSLSFKFFHEHDIFQDGYIIEPAQLIESGSLHKQTLVSVRNAAQSCSHGGKEADNLDPAVVGSNKHLEAAHAIGPQG